MRVLFVTNRFPRPGSRGDQLRAFEHIRALSIKHEITLLCFAKPENESSLRVLRDVCASVHWVERSKWNMLRHGLRALWNQEPLQVAIFAGNPAQTWLDQANQDHGFDLVHVQLARLGSFIQQVLPSPCVVDLVDALSLNMQRRAEFDRQPWRWFAKMESKRLYSYERELCGLAKSVAISSDVDRQYLNRPELQLVPNGVDLNRFEFSQTRRPNQNIVFIGNLGYFPNIDGITWFANEVMPRVLADAPQARLRIVGKRPSIAIQDLALRNGFIDLVGEVDDVYHELSSARLAIVPLRAGSGQQLKLIEAMAAGTPVVTTRTAADGLTNDVARLNDQAEVLIVEDVNTMSNAVLRLLQDDALCESLAGKARVFVESHHCWEHSADLLEAVWQQALA